MATQRSFRILAGHQDCNDTNSLRFDSVFNTVCNRLPESDPELASQPKLSRLENSVRRKDLLRIGEWFSDSYLKHRKKSRPKKITLDLDSTDDPMHGQQEFSFYHRFYKEHIYHPLLIFNAETEDLIYAMLRPGNPGAASGVVAVLKRLVKKMRRKLAKKLQIEIRADSGFATPQLYDYCECEKLSYVIGFARNWRLQTGIEAFVEKVLTDFNRTQEAQRQFTELFYQANRWDHPRRMIAKVEVADAGLNQRFVVTNRRDLSAQNLYEYYVHRGQAENFVKALKKDLAMDRLSCQGFVVNPFRLWLHALAYPLILRLQNYLIGTLWQNLEAETWRRRLFKNGDRVHESPPRILIHFASSNPKQKIFALRIRQLCPT